MPPKQKIGKQQETFHGGGSTPAKQRPSSGGSRGEAEESPHVQAISLHFATVLAPRNASLQILDLAQCNSCNQHLLNEQIIN